MIDSPLRHLNRFSKRYPHAWRWAEKLWLDRTNLPEWPEWCFLPVTLWRDILIAEKDPDPGDLDSLAALGAWRYTQGIYRFSPELLDAVKTTDLQGEIPADVLYRLPQWSIYIELPGFEFSGVPLVGVFAFLEYNIHHNRPELQITADLGDSLLGIPRLWLGEWSVEEALQKAVNNAVNDMRSSNPEHRMLTLADNIKFTTVLNDMARQAKPIVSLLLYLCSDEPDIEGHVPGVSQQRPAAKKTKKGWRLFPPDKPKIWDAGKETSEILRQATTGQPRPDGHASPRPHIRRAHWHGFWTGPRNQTPDGPERRFSYRWLPPIVVGIGGSE